MPEDVISLDAVRQRRSRAEPTRLMVDSIEAALERTLVLAADLAGRVVVVEQANAALTARLDAVTAQLTAVRVLLRHGVPAAGETGAAREVTLAADR